MASQEITGYIVVHSGCRDAAEAATEGEGARTEFLGYGRTRAAALCGVGKKLDELAQYGDDYTFNLSVIGATEELLDATRLDWRRGRRDVAPGIHRARAPTRARIDAYGIGIVASNRVYGEIIFPTSKLEDLQLGLYPFESQPERAVLHDGLYICLLAGERGIWEPVQVENPRIFSFRWGPSPFMVISPRLDDMTSLAFVADRADRFERRLFRGAP